MIKELKKLQDEEKGEIEINTISPRTLMFGSVEVSFSLFQKPQGESKSAENVKKSQQGFLKK